MASDQPAVLARPRGRRVWRGLVAAAAFAAVATDYHGDPTAYFTYFTVLTNLAIGIWFLGAALAPRRFERASTVRLAVTVYGLVTVAVYWALLAPTHHPQGTHFVANLFLHLFVPAAMVAEDLRVPWPRIGLWRPLWILGFPLAYCVASLVRGELTGWYPYFFLDKRAMGGWAPLGTFAAGLLVVFAGLGYGWRALVHRKAAAT